MPEIKILPEDLINKIAAGEVVERPASVVKELLDNAYDAKANQINIEIAKGGKSKILVIDNGKGMDKEDLELAFKPHATSKINDIDDLMRIKSYGFRGEALSSISAVSKLTIRSRQPSSDIGYELKIEGGQVISLQEIGIQVGTTIEINDLFYNVPARKEFLKSDQSEYLAILQEVNSHALANPAVGINFNNNDKPVYNLAKDQQLEDRVGDIVGKDNYNAMIPLFYEHPHIEIYGFVGKPEIASQRSKNQYIFVNKRRIFDKSLAYAVKEAYSSLIPKDNYPQYAIFIDVQPNIVDVNVHPRKEEVKFSNPNLLFTSVKTAVQKALDRVDLTPGTQDNNIDSNKDLLASFNKPPQPMRKGISPFSNAPTGNKQGSLNKPNATPFGNIPKPKSDPFGQRQMNKQKPIDPFSFPKPARPSNRLNDANKETFKDLDSPNPFDVANYQLSKPNILHIQNLYLLKETEDGIIIYDQHAVHERVIYEKLIKNHIQEKEKSDIQNLLTPIVLNLSVEEYEILKTNLDNVEKSGIKIEEFGPNSFKIIEVPAILADLDLKAIIRELIEDLENDNKNKDESSVDSQSNKILTYLSCRSAYKAGDVIPNQEVEAMIQQLEQTDIKYTCPHGRPVKVVITMDELAKMFKRK